MPTSVYQRKLYALLHLHPTDLSLPEETRTTLLAALFPDNSTREALRSWWQSEENPVGGAQTAQIASSSDRVNLNSQETNAERVKVRHPISGQEQTLNPLNSLSEDAIQKIEAAARRLSDTQLFWWLWRFYPELLAQSDSQALLFPAHSVLPDCPLHSYRSTVSALVGAMFSEDWQEGQEPEHPYLLIFTFSPVQEFIKASRKFLDFWAGSYLLHYLSAKLCWFVANQYGPDAIITPSLWSQEIIDTFLLNPPLSEDGEETPAFMDSATIDWLVQRFQEIGDGQTPAKRFNDKLSNSLSTAGFPNVITVLVPGKAKAKKLGNDLAARLRKDWIELGSAVRDDIRNRVSQEVTRSADSWKTLGEEILVGMPLPPHQNLEDLTEQWNTLGNTIRQQIQAREAEINPLGRSAKERQELTNEERHQIFAQVLDGEIAQQSALTSELLLPYLQDLRKWILDSNWEWGKLWDAQLKHTWEPYWAAVPLGDPGQHLEIQRQGETFDDDWKKAQSLLSQAWEAIPSPAEEKAFDRLNVGTWWGSFQQRLRLCIQAVKNTRVWDIPVAPGERSTISGQFSAVHPNLNYGVVQRNGNTRDFREGSGLPAGSMRLFWLLMAKAFPGLFSGSEHLNALELTKRMAWQFGGVAASLGISTQIEPESFDDEDIENLRLGENAQSDAIDYERLIRFPNASSIAAARFVHDELQREAELARANPGQPRTSMPRRYWNVLVREVMTELGEQGIELGEQDAERQERDRRREMRRRLASRTRCRALQVPKTDAIINPDNNPGRNFNGVMFSSKWLADDMGLTKTRPDAGNGETPRSEDASEVARLRRAVDRAHQKAGFKQGSPADWWAVVLADGDGMGQYISGSKLQPYEEYLVDVDESRFTGDLAEDYRQLCQETRKRMGPATHIGLNRALLDFSNRLVPYLTEKRFCGKTIYSGGDDVMAVLPLEDLPDYLRSLRAAWCGGSDPAEDEICQFRVANPDGSDNEASGYWYPEFQGRDESEIETNRTRSGLPNRPLFTMGAGATMSMGIVIAYKTVPLPTVLEHLWVAEKDRAKEIPGKDGLCFRVIYGGGNTLEALMKGNLLDSWWQILQQPHEKLSPALYRLAEELPKRAEVTADLELCAKAAKVILNRRDAQKELEKPFERLEAWIGEWERWAWEEREKERLKLEAQQLELTQDRLPLGTTPDELGYLLRFTAFWIDKMVQRQQWVQRAADSSLDNNDASGGE